MANKRMFSKTMILMDAFSEMTHGAQLLYFYMCLEADDDGFVDNVMSIMKGHDLKKEHVDELLTKRFVLQRSASVYVIKHWFLHNSIPKDRYKPTKYEDERKGLEKKDDGAYTLNRKQNGDETLPQIRLDKNRIDKKDTAESKDSEQKKEMDRMIPLILKEFESINPACKTMYGNKTQREAVAFLIETYTFDKVKTAVKQVLPLTNGQPFFPTITTPVQLQHKFAQLEAAWHKKGVEVKKSKSQVAF